MKIYPTVAASFLLLAIADAGETRKLSKGGSPAGKEGKGSKGARHPASCPSTLGKPDDFSCFIVQTQNGAIRDFVDGDPCVQGLCIGTTYSDEYGLPDDLGEKAGAFFYSRFYSSLDPNSFLALTQTPSGCAASGACPLQGVCSLLPGGDCPKLLIVPFTLDAEGLNQRANAFSVDKEVLDNCGTGCEGGNADVPKEGLKMKEGGFAALSLDFDPLSQYPFLTAFFLAEYKYLDEEDNAIATISWRSLEAGLLDGNGNRALLDETKFGTLEDTLFWDETVDADGLSALFAGAVQVDGTAYSILRNVITCGNSLPGLPGFA